MIYKLNHESWHFKLANFACDSMNRRVSRHGTNICEYTRAIMFGTFWFLMAVFFSGLFGVWIGYSIYDTVTCLIYGGMPVPSTFIFLGTVMSLLAMTGVYVAVEKYKEHKEAKIEQSIIDGTWKDPHKRNPSFLTLAYRKFKDKTCFRIEFE